VKSFSGGIVDEDDGSTNLFAHFAPPMLGQPGQSVTRSLVVLLSHV
jgi:hypothetical protein